MPRPFFRIGAYFGFGLASGLAMAAVAAPLDPGQIHADAAWVVHVDNEALNASAMNAKVRALDPAVADQSEKEFRDNFGLDPKTDLFGLTIYGGDQGPEDAIVIADVRAQAAADLPRFLERKRLSGLMQLDEGGRTFHQWTLEGRPFVMLITPAADESRRRVILGASTQGVVKAARVASGELSSQKSLREPTLRTQPGANAALFVSVRGAGNGEEGDARAALFRSAQSIVVEMGETPAGAAAPVDPAAGVGDAAVPAAGPRVYFEMRLDTTAEKTAKQLGQVVQGLASFARLQVAEQKDLQQLVDMLDQVKVSVESNSVRVHAACSSEDFARVLVNPRVDAYVKTLIPATGGMGLSGSPGQKPAATPVEPAARPASNAPVGAKGGEEGTR
jgi:hypothetical protein